MTQVSNADVYASFGVNPTATAGPAQSEHTDAMLALNVDTRDGDDQINTVSNDDPYNDVDPFANPEDDDGTRQSIRISQDGEQQEEAVTPEEESSDVTEDEFHAVGEVPSELSTASEQLGQHEAGFQEMVDAASERGLPVESITRIQEEYQGEGLTAETYDELAKAGYSKSFVDSYIRGQEALVESYVKSVFEFAGGEKQFVSITKHLELTNPEAAQSLSSALESRDLATVKAIVNLAGASRNKAFGKPAARSVTTQAKPAGPVSTKVKGFENAQEMMTAMSDPRYRSDAAFRKSVETKMLYTNY